MKKTKHYQPEAPSDESVFVHKKSLGQNFLNSEFVPQKMCDAGDVQPGDTVFEIGPGTGALTKELLRRGATVIAVEADLRAIAILETEFETAIANKMLQLHHGDARNLQVGNYGLKDGQFKVIANIPYYLSGFLLRTLLESTIQPTTLVFLIQKELAERIVRSKKESLLSLSVKAFGEPTYVTTIKRGHFTPPPNVDSAILAINNISQNNFKTINPEAFFTLLHLGFGQKRKQLQHNLSATCEKEVIFTLLDSLNLPSTVRAEDVPLSAWLDITKALS